MIQGIPLQFEKKKVLRYEECIRFLSLIKCPHKYSDGLRSCNCGVKSSVAFFGVKMVLAKCWLYFGTLSCCSITSWILPKQCVTKYLIHSSTLDSLYLHENLASPLFKCSLEITTHILRAFCWFLTFYFANHASVKKSFMYRFRNDVVTSGLRHCDFSITDTVSPKCTGVSCTFKTFSQALRIWHRTIWVTLSWCHVSHHHSAT